MNFKDYAKTKAASAFRVFTAIAVTVRHQERNKNYRHSQQGARILQLRLLGSQVLSHLPQADIHWISSVELKRAIKSDRTRAERYHTGVRPRDYDRIVFAEASTKGL